jgi:hypothetical protein
VCLNSTNLSKGAGPTASGIKRRTECLLLVLAVPVHLAEVNFALLRQFSTFVSYIVTLVVSGGLISNRTCWDFLKMDFHKFFKIGG